MIPSYSLLSTQEEALNLFRECISCKKAIALDLDEINLESAEEIAKRLAQIVQNSQLHVLMLLEGQLGAGKTTFCQSFITAWLSKPLESVESPTYAYVIPYTNDSGLVLYHFDLYRLHSSDEFVALGFDEYWKEPGFSLIEWPDRIADLIESKSLIKLKINYTDKPNTRQWQLSYHP